LAPSCPVCVYAKAKTHCAKSVISTSIAICPLRCLRKTVSLAHLDPLSTVCTYRHQNMLTCRACTVCCYSSGILLTLLPHKACSSLIYSPKADIPAFLNMPNTPKAFVLLRIVSVSNVHACTGQWFCVRLSLTACLYVFFMSTFCLSVLTIFSVCGCRLAK